MGGHDAANRGHCVGVLVLAAQRLQVKDCACVCGLVLLSGRRLISTFDQAMPTNLDPNGKGDCKAVCAIRNGNGVVAGCVNALTAACLTSWCRSMCWTAAASA